MHVSDYFKTFVAYYVESAVLYEEMHSRKKYLKRYCALENCDFDKLAEDLNLLIEALNEYKDKKSKVCLKVAQRQAKYCHLPDNFIEDISNNILLWGKNYTHSPYTKVNDGDIFNEMPGGKMLRSDLEKDVNEVSHVGVSVEMPSSTPSKSNATIGISNGHEWVDLGLPSGLKWATCNIGASSGSGSYYAWGEIMPKREYGWDNLRFYHADGDYFIKYSTLDNKKQLDLSDDVARRNWGAKWRMPTRTEFEELAKYCNIKLITRKGYDGYEVTSKINGNSIFFPAGGYMDGSLFVGDASYGSYWTSTIYEHNRHHAWQFFFWDYFWGTEDVDRCNGKFIRPITE